MPVPFAPPIVSILSDIHTEIQAQSALITSLEATVALQATDIQRLAQLARYTAEGTFGPGANVTGIWDGTDLYV